MEVIAWRLIFIIMVMVALWYGIGGGDKGAHV